MTATFSHTYDLPVGVEQAFALLGSTEWADAKARELSDGCTVVRHEVAPDGGVVLQVTRDLPAGVPGFLTRFLPPDNKAGQTDTWEPLGADGVRRGRWEAHVPGAPAQVAGTMRLEPADGPTAGCRYVVDGSVTVKVPLVGGKAESFVAGMTGRLTDAEARLLARLLG